MVDILLGSEVLLEPSACGPAEVGGEVYGRFADSAFLGGDDDHTVGSLSTVDGCSRGIFQDIDLLDIVRIDFRELSVEDHSVYNL